jgi:plasmid stability protein
MPTITVKNIPSDLYEKLKVSAQQSRRSVNSEVIVRLERSLEPREISTEEMLSRARSLRRRVGRKFSLSELNSFRKRGRK